MVDLELKPEYKAKIIALTSALFPNAKIYLYGSRARGTHRERSDIDIAIDDGKEIGLAEMGEVKEVLYASNVPYRLDVVDMHCIPAYLKAAILEEGILWKR